MANIGRTTMTVSTLLKSTAIAGSLGVGLLLTTVSGALAHYTTTHCDSDGDRCWSVRCDDDGDDCRRVSSYDNYGAYNRYNYGSRYYYYGSAYNRSYRNRYGYWRCDRDGDDCHWVGSYRYYGDYERDYGD